MKEPIVLLGHIIESIEYVENFVDGIDFKAFENSVEKQDAVQRRFEIIGEAVKNLPNEIKDQYKEIPWKEVASLRDLLIHEYFNVSLKQVWIVVERDMPKLKQVILKMIKDLT
jgi:uncharacterized protein with HEPN domain